METMQISLLSCHFICGRFKSGQFSLCLSLQCQPVASVTVFDWWKHGSFPRSPLEAQLSVKKPRPASFRLEAHEVTSCREQAPAGMMSVLPSALLLPNDCPYLNGSRQELLSCLGCAQPKLLTHKVNSPLST